jgi:O-antigen/teichoic acid export membrane protein
MKKGLRHFGKQTAIYTIGNIIYRGASFVLVPLYAHQLPVEEYGKLEVLTITIYILQSVLSSGVSHSVMRYYFEYDDEARRKGVVSTALIASFTISGLGALLFASFSAPFSRLVYGDPSYASAFMIAAATMTLETSREISLSVLRAREKAITFIAAGIVQFPLQVGITYYTVAVAGMGMRGVLVANLISVSIIWIALTAITLAHSGVKFEPRLLKPLAQYGSPMMLNTLSFAAFQSIDRYALVAYASLGQLGQYALAVRIATAVTALLVDPFKTSYGPFRLSIMKQPDVGPVYSRVLTYYFMTVSLVVVGIAASSREIVRIVSQPEFWPAATLIPFLIVSPLLSGVDYCFQTGILIQKRTLSMFYASFIKGGAHLAVLFYLVPRYGIQGAAWAGVFGGLFGVSITALVAQRVHPIPYDFTKLLKAALSAIVVGGIAHSLPISSLWLALVLRSAVVLSLPLVLVAVGCLSADELKMLADYLIRRRPVAAAAPSAVTDPT